MLPDRNPSTADLRSHAIDSKRDTESKHKWEPKWSAAYKCIPTIKVGPNNSKRPVGRLHSQRCQIKDRQANEKHVKRNAKERKQDVLSGKGERAHDSSSDDTSSQTSRTTEPDCEVTYAFDGYVDQARGMDVLSMALNKAVEKYDQQTLVKLVKDEYEVLDVVSDDDEFEADDDFELI